MDISMAADATLAWLMTTTGESVTITHYSPGTYNPATNVNTRPSATHTAKALPQNARREEVKASNSLTEFKWLRVRAADWPWQPAPDDNVTQGGNAFIVDRVEIIRSNGVDVSYRILIYR